MSVLGTTPNIKDLHEIFKKCQGHCPDTVRHLKVPALKRGKQGGLDDTENDQKVSALPYDLFTLVGILHGTITLGKL